MESETHSYRHRHGNRQIDSFRSAIEKMISFMKLPRQKRKRGGPAFGPSLSFPSSFLLPLSYLILTQRDSNRAVSNSQPNTPTARLILFVENDGLKAKYISSQFDATGELKALHVEYTLFALYGITRVMLSAEHKARRITRSAAVRWSCSRMCVSMGVAGIMRE